MRIFSAATSELVATYRDRKRGYCEVAPVSETGVEFFQETEMKASTFFNNCREMARSRWVAVILPSGEIVLHRLLEKHWPLKRWYSPVNAVAVDIFGSLIPDPPVLSLSAEALELSREVARLVSLGARRSGDPDPLVTEVRRELLSAISIPDWVRGARIPGLHYSEFLGIRPLE